MADAYGKSYFSWVQRSYSRIPDPIGISANSNWQLAKPCSASPCPGSPESPVLALWGGRLRGENGGCL
jgi:hypothetical protein